MAGKWTVLSSETLIKDRWIDLRADVCRTPGGVEIAPYYLLRYPDLVHIVALTENDEIVLVREYRHGVGEVCLGIPGGLIDASDGGPENAARRELAEEGGYEASDWRPVARLQVDPARQDNHLHIFLARGLRPLARRRLDAGEEGMSVEIWPLARLLDGLARGSLPFTDHVASLLMGLGAAGRLRLA